MLIDGKSIAETIMRQLAGEVEKLPFRPLFCDMIVGEDPVAVSYVNIKEKAARRIGLEFRRIQLPASISQPDLEMAVARANSLEHLCGLIIQLPLPDGIDRNAVLGAIDPNLDVDCIGPKNSELFYGGRSALVPPTAGAVMAILESLHIGLAHKKIVVVGQGDLVGKPVTYLLKQRGLQVSTADRSVADLAALAREADVLVSGTGQPKLITGDMVKPGAIVIDAGTAESGGGIVGDIDAATVSRVAGFVSPVPGGVGPVTVAMLLSNVVRVARELNK